MAAIVFLAHSSLILPLRPAVELRRAPRVTLQEREKDGAVGGAIGGAVLGGLLGGPFGAIWGAQIGGGLGAQRQAAAREQASLERMGLGKEVQAAAQAVARDLQEAEASLQLTKDALQTQQNLVKTLEEAAAALKASAQAALVKGDEAGARAKLVEKQSVTSKITAAQLEVADARDRVARMQSSVAALAAKAGEVEAMIGRSVEASSELRSEIAIEDPLEAKFRDL